KCDGCELDEEETPYTKKGQIVINNKLAELLPQLDELISRLLYHQSIQIDSTINQIANRNIYTDNIDKYLKKTNCRNELKNIKMKLHNVDNLIFYTDGSLIEANTQNIDMTFSFHNTNMNLTFSSRCNNWPSSTHAELMGILSAILVTEIFGILLLN
ncbi:hypothetical protein C1645_822761, partial [Glomus cerebriforme]